MLWTWRYNLLIRVMIPSSRIIVIISTFVRLKLIWISTIVIVLDFVDYLWRIRLLVSKRKTRNVTWGIFKLFFTTNWFCCFVFRIVLSLNWVFFDFRSLQVLHTYLKFFIVIVPLRRNWLKGRCHFRSSSTFLCQRNFPLAKLNLFWPDFLDLS